jgi:hypothetical protein
MNNIERLFWLSGIVFLAFFALDKMSKIDALETMQSNYNIKLLNLIAEKQ